MDAIRTYVQGAFAGVEPTPKVIDQQEEIIADLSEKVADLMAHGASEDEALGQVLGSVGDLSALAREFAAVQRRRAADEAAAERVRAAEVVLVQRQSAMPGWLKITLAVMGLVVLLVVISGLAGAALFFPVRSVVREVRTTPNGVDQMQVEYRQAAAKLTLPSGVIFPDNSGAGEDPAHTVYSKGVGVNNAQLYWIRAWEMEWLTQRTKDPARAKKALHVLAVDVPRSEFMTSADDVTRQFWRDYIAKAEKGDPSGFKQDVDVNPMKLVFAPAGK